MQHTRERKGVSAEHARLMRRATHLALAVALTLAASKALAWWLSGSVSLLAGLTDSLLDGAASLLNLLAVHYSLRPADDDHRYGHGKAEALAGLGQGAFISVSAILVCVQGVDRMLHPQPLGAPTLGIAVMLLSLALTVALLMYQRHVVRETGSTAIRADSLHYRSDLLLNSSILVALVLTGYGLERLDAVFGIAIAVYIFWSALSIVREAGAVLMDTELAPEISEHMHQLACDVPGVVGCHDLRTRVSGTRWFVQMHLELPGELPLIEAHALCDAVETAIHSQYPRAEVLVHADPLEVVKPRPPEPTERP
ncbi:divalent metal cation transporter FieF [Pseudomonas sp. Choline-3u-10]|jgi:ferrous-iron efflux pump FieF|uniref:cation diffusion facilitator family transporter n=1 Tax=Pseudomonadaceae TaxID=135621 RepID=UPI00061835EA|nr:MULTISPECIES: cation diffusion facilitator family transporter [Pseudomonadaceae]MAL36745.1 divalent metal cation transporter FieF [Pseudomonas sp.]MBU0948518.1 cation diffusion facilitator family transporter [Gammaproteobacteria bacterium]KJJ64421.1 ferrous iron transporter [Pseudomonas sp. 10B238]MBK3793616.1 cation diffusion facilitator family transporter [Stutzerimonas stutzeri]MBK3875106.1 cation diffusion facilitator family transporter [Stutzerimonas stutzeri]|tara:strand:+ start:469 stop:1401 length:933 start_codon:yes stop_codon:yes gene_type:complete